MVAGRWVVRDGRHAGEERSARAFVQVLGTARLTLRSGGQPRCAYPPHSFEPSSAKRRYFPRQPPGMNGAGKKNAPVGRSFTGSASTGRRVPARSARPPRNRGCALLPADARGSAAKPAGTRQQPQVFTVRIAHQRGTVVVVHRQHPIVAARHVGEEIGEPVVEAHPQLVGATRLLGDRPPSTCSQSPSRVRQRLITWMLWSSCKR